MRLLTGFSHPQNKVDGPDPQCQSAHGEMGETLAWRSKTMNVSGTQMISGQPLSSQDLSYLTAEGRVAQGQSHSARCQG